MSSPNFSSSAAAVADPSPSSTLPAAKRQRVIVPTSITDSSEPSNISPSTMLAGSTPTSSSVSTTPRIPSFNDHEHLEAQCSSVSTTPLAGCHHGGCDAITTEKRGGGGGGGGGGEVIHADVGGGEGKEKEKENKKEESTPGKTTSTTSSTSTSTPTSTSSTTTQCSFSNTNTCDGIHSDGFYTGYGAITEPLSTPISASPAQPTRIISDPMLSAMTPSRTPAIGMMAYQEPDPRDLLVDDPGRFFHSSDDPTHPYELTRVTSNITVGSGIGPSSSKRKREDDEKHDDKQEDKHDEKHDDKHEDEDDHEMNGMDDEDDDEEMEHEHKRIQHSSSSSCSDDDDDEHEHKHPPGHSRIISSDSDDDIDTLPTTKVMRWIEQRRDDGDSPMEVLQQLVEIGESVIPAELLWQLCFRVGIHVTRHMYRPRPRRRKLPHINTLEDVVRLIQQSNKIVILTGAGISVAAGIPDFRSRGGIYVRLREEFGMPEPECMFDMDYFRANPQIFYSFAHELWPGNHHPTRSHQFIATVEKKGKLLRNYTQNIDTLESCASITRAFQCHGSFSTASCITCKRKIPGEQLHPYVMNKEIAKCEYCHSTTLDPLDPRIHDKSYGVIKPDIVFFGEGLPDSFDKHVEEDRKIADLVIVMGSSLKVHPVAGMISRFPPETPMILINREVVGYPDEFDVELLGWELDTTIAPGVFAPTRTHDTTTTTTTTSVNVTQTTTHGDQRVTVSETTVTQQTKVEETPAITSESTETSTSAISTTSTSSSSTSSTSPSTSTSNKLDTSFTQVAPNRYLFYGAAHDIPESSDDDCDDEDDEKRKAEASARIERQKAEEARFKAVVEAQRKIQAEQKEMGFTTGTTSTTTSSTTEEKIADDGTGLLSAQLRPVHDSTVDDADRVLPLHTDLIVEGSHDHPVNGVSISSLPPEPGVDATQLLESPHDPPEEHGQ